MKLSLRLVCVICAIALCAVGLTGCGDTSAVTLAFSAANNLEELSALSGQQVTIVGYMATLSPLNGEYMYLMNMPYQSCPFCVPNSQQLSNTIAVYAKDGKTFEFTDRCIRVTGTLEVADFEDDFGYTYNYRIKNASYAVVDTSELGEKYTLWQTIAEDGIVNEVYSMMDYLHFVCQWQDYTFQIPDENGEYITVNMYPGDAQNYLESDGEYCYYYEAFGTYFDDLIARANSISPELDSLVSIITAAKQVSEYAIADLYAGNYTYNPDTDSYIQTNYEELYHMWYNVYYDFSMWLGEWEI